MKKKIAVILCNLGGPDKLESVKPFLFNLFNDKAIINLPNPFRYMIAKLISSRREETAKEIYSHLGDKSPILEQTISQAKELDKILNEDENIEYKSFIAMRYWHPFTEEVIVQLKNYQPDEVVFLPLYPQFSTTTTGSSFKFFKELFIKEFKETPLKTICCYPTEEGFINAQIEELKNKIDAAKTELQGKNIHIEILFSAHGLPEKIIKAGDPYQWQVEQSVAQIVKNIDEELSYTICYQSRVGPLKWIGPATDSVIEQNAQKNNAIIIVPIAFVSEHSETLVELDIEYDELFKEKGGKYYYRVPTLQINENYLQSLKKMVLYALNIEDGTVTSSLGVKLCPKEFCNCPSNTMSVE